MPLPTTDESFTRQSRRRETPGRATLLIMVHRGSRRTDERQNLPTDPDEEVGAIVGAWLAPLGVASRRLELARRRSAPAHAEVDRLARLVESRAEAVADEATATGAPVACYASGLVAAAVLRAAARRPTLFAALALRSVTLDPAWPSLRWVRTPTLLLAAAYDQPSVDFHRLAALEIGPSASVRVLPRVTRTLSGPGARYAAASAAARWLAHELRRAEPAGTAADPGAADPVRASLERSVEWFVRGYHAAANLVGSFGAAER